MNRLNYFNPYQSKDGQHEDQLTRAYLVLLKHSFHAFAVFFDYTKSKHLVVNNNDEKPLELNTLLENGWDIETQKANPLITTNWLLSVLITDTDLKGNNETIAASNRNAVYDGIIRFGTNLTVIIENKPRSGNVWFGQLHPSRGNLLEETKVYSNAAHLEWKVIIKQLNHVVNLPSIAGNEKMMIEDFLSFIDDNFPYLNPYDSFHLCKGNIELINRRINSILKSIVNDESIVKYHQGWGYYIETPYQAISKIGLIQGKTKNDIWYLELSFYFGDTQSQAKVFYRSSPSISHLDKKQWWFLKNFHVAFRSSNLVWFNKGENYSEYLSYWHKNIYKIFQQKRPDVKAYIEWLKMDNVVTIMNDDEDRLQDRFYNTAMQTLNICPGFGAIYEISLTDAENLDKQGTLKHLLKQAIAEGLSIIKKDGSEFLK